MDENTYPLVQKLGIRDSKQLTDEQIRKIGPQLLQALPHSLLILDNQSYNRVHDTNNLNAIKAKLHNKAYINLSNKCGLPKLITIDQFTPEDTYYRYLKEEPQVVKGINFETKAEDRQFIQKYGKEKLGLVAKLHFKNTERL